MENFKLELKHLSSYLPYELECLDEKENKTFTLSLIDVKNKTVNDKSYMLNDCNNIKPLLIPINLISSFDDIMGKFSEYSWCQFKECVLDVGFNDGYEVLGYKQAELCLKHHIDIFGLINKKLAINKIDYNFKLASNGK